MPADSLSARLVAHLVADSRSQSGAAPGSVDAVATAFRRITSELSRSLGPDGCRALLSRAFRRATPHHPVLAGITIASGSHPRLEGLAGSIEAHGAKATVAGLEATLVALFELLGRLVGDDLAAKLAELSQTNGADLVNPEDEESHT